MVRFIVSLWEQVQMTVSRPNLIRMAKHRGEAWDEVDAGDVTSCRLVQLAVYGFVDHITAPPFSSGTRNRILMVYCVAIFAFFAVAMTLVAIDRGISWTIITGGLMAMFLAGVALAGWAIAKLLSWTAKTAAVSHCPFEN